MTKVTCDNAFEVIHDNGKVEYFYISSTRETVNSEIVYLPPRNNKMTESCLGLSEGSPIRNLHATIGKVLPYDCMDEYIKSNSPNQIRKKEKRDEIYSFLRSRGVNKFVHFTRIENLESILTRGLLSQRELNAKSIDHICGDGEDNSHPNNVSLSIEFPNYRMFFPKRKNTQNDQWVVLSLNVKKIVSDLDLDLVFCPINAADRHCNAEMGKSLDSLRKMFADEIFSRKKNEISEIVKRTDLGIPPNYTTNPQAEILVNGGIKPQYIESIDFYSNAKKEQFVSRYGNRFCLTHGIFFMSRCDHDYWN